MPITINGSGTVTGISVGGLPDGIVDNDTIANSTIAAGKCAFSPGKVLQYKREYVYDNHNLGSGTHADLLPISITPTDATTKILVTLNVALGQMNPEGGIGVNYKYGSGSNTQLKTSGPAGNSGEFEAGYYSLSDWSVCDDDTVTSFTMDFIHDHDQTAAITYSLVLNGFTEAHVNRAKNLNQASGISVWTLLEMAT